MGRRHRTRPATRDRRGENPARRRSCSSACGQGHRVRSRHPAQLRARDYGYCLACDFGQPHAFISAIYAGEVAYCLPLWDPGSDLERLKALTLPYPQALPLDDAVYAAGCTFRCVACLCQVLCAHNGVYLLNEKGGTVAVEGLARRPDAFRSRVLEAFGGIGSARTQKG